MPGTERARRAPPAALLWVIAATCAVALADLHHTELRAWLATDAPGLTWLRDSVLRPFKWSIALNLATPAFAVGFALLLGLERWRPARPGQALFSRGLLCDAAWIPVKEVGCAVFVFGAIGAVRSAFDANLGFLVVSGVRDLPIAVQWIGTLIVFDFVYYLVHVIHHRVPFLWELHAVHHSQRELNALTAQRVHFLSSFSTFLLYAIPVGVFSLDIATAGPPALFVLWQNRLVHSNVRASFGPLRFVFVTPQSHRVHHGLDERYRDHNFGQTLCVWDRLFGTQYPGCDEYPQTGIADATFPLEQQCEGLGVLLAPLRQAFHPLPRVLRLVWPGGPRDRLQPGAAPHTASD